jgi:hypothetical protein
MDTAIQMGLRTHPRSVISVSGLGSRGHYGTRFCACHRLIHGRKEGLNKPCAIV